MNFTPRGIIIPIVTPIHADGTFNETAYRKLLAHFVDSGVHGVFPFGTTGEFYAFSNAEYRRVLEVTKDAVGGKMQIYAGANHITPQGAIALAQIAQEVQVDALSVLTPMFVSQTQEELYTYFETVAKGTNLPVIIYNNPPKTNVNITPATVARLAKIPNIVAIKDSSGDMTSAEEYIRLTRGIEGFSVLMGRDTMIYAGLCYGAAGAITSCANVAPKLAVDIYTSYTRGDHKGALEAQFKFAQLRIATNLGTFPVVIKEGLNLLGFDVGPCAPPILPLGEGEREKLAAVMRDIGVL